MSLVVKELEIADRLLHRGDYGFVGFDRDAEVEGKWFEVSEAAAAGLRPLRRKTCYFYKKVGVKNESQKK
jgi:hypothetical protein